MSERLETHLMALRRDLPGSGGHGVGPFPAATFQHHKHEHSGHCRARNMVVSSASGYIVMRWIGIITVMSVSHAFMLILRRLISTATVVRHCINPRLNHNLCDVQEYIQLLLHA